MTKPDPLNQIPFFYHFTDYRNLALIRELGGLYPLARLKRNGIEVPAPGGNRWSQEADGLKGMDEYVHLCFRDTHPMEFRAREEGRIERSIFLLIDRKVLQLDGLRFTPDVSNKSGVCSYTIEEAREMIDFEVLYTRTDWCNPEIQQRLQQAEKCEILVPVRIPLNLILNIQNG
jgi:hypothetical protein